MDKKYSVNFLTAFVENLQAVCNRYLDYDNFVEISGYISVEIDNLKKERYVLSELLQSSGNVVSESFCTKSFTTGVDSRKGSVPVAMVAKSSQISPHPDQTAGLRKPGNTLPVDQRLAERRMHLNQDDQSACGQSSRRPLKRPAHDSVLASHQQKVLLLSRTDECFLPSAKSPASSSTKFVADVKHEHELVEEVQIRFPHKMSDRNNGNAENTSFYETSVDKEGGSMTLSLDSEDVVDVDLFDDGVPSFHCPIPPVTVPSMYLKESALYPVAVSGPMGTPGLQTTESKISPGSQCAMKSSIKQFQRYHFEKYGQEVDLLSTSPEQLNEKLLDFYQGAKTLQGPALNPGSMKNVQIYLDKFLRENGYLYSISKDEQFQTSREYIKSKVNEMSKSLQVPKHLPVNDEDIEILFLREILGVCKPEAVINAMWVMNSKYFAMRGPSDHFKFQWGDIALRVDSLGNEYLEYLGNPLAAFTLKVHAKPENPSRCFVNIYKVYMAVRPQLMSEADSAFYLKPQKAIPVVQDAWFGPEPMSWSSLTGLWKRMLFASGLPMHKKIF